MQVKKIKYRSLENISIEGVDKQIRKMTKETGGEAGEIILIDAKQERNFKLKWKDIIKYHRWLQKESFRLGDFKDIDKLLCPI